MAWSTSQLAELAGTTLRAVRHYHEVGLLAEPERRTNGYKSYGVAHLVRLLRIKRLTELGFSLAQIAAMGAADVPPEQALRALDAELAANIERLQQVRTELATTMAQGTPTDLPPALAAASAHIELSEADRAFIVVLSRVLGPAGIETYIELFRGYHTEPEALEFDRLPADADDHTRQHLAERTVPRIRALVAAHPGLLSSTDDAPRGRRFAAEAIGTAIDDLYNPAQLDVLARVSRLLERTSAD